MRESDIQPPLGPAVILVKQKVAVDVHAAEWRGLREPIAWSHGRGN